MKRNITFIGQFYYPFIGIKEINQRDIQGLIYEQELTKQRYLNDPNKDKRSQKCYWKDRSNKTIFKPFGKAPNSNYKTWVLAECIECHNYHWIFDYNFKDAHCQTCPFCKASGDRIDPYVHYEKGKILTPLNDLRGQIFGDILVNNKNPVDFGNGHCLYEVTCLRCGKIFYERDDYLTILKHSCCDECKKKKSYLEEAIASILTSHHISYTYEKKFDNLFGVHKGKLSYDFYININNCEYLIEAQGEQHYKSSEYFGGEEQFKIRQEHDKRKKEYAILNNFKLIEIPYNAKNIEQYLIDIL